MKIFKTTLYDLSLIVTVEPRTLRICASDSYEAITTVTSKQGEGEYTYGEVEIAVKETLHIFVSYDETEIAAILQDMWKELGQ